MQCTERTSSGIVEGHVASPISISMPTMEKVAVIVRAVNQFSRFRDPKRSTVSAQQWTYKVMYLVFRFLNLIHVTPLSWDRKGNTLVGEGADAAAATSSRSQRWNSRWLKWRLIISMTILLAIAVIVQGRKIFERNISNGSSSNQLFIVWKLAECFICAIFVCLGSHNLQHAKSFPSMLNTALEQYRRILGRQKLKYSDSCCKMDNVNEL